MRKALDGLVVAGECECGGERSVTRGSEQDQPVDDGGLFLKPRGAARGEQRGSPCDRDQKERLLGSGCSLAKAWIVSTSNVADSSMFLRQSKAAVRTSQAARIQVVLQPGVDRRDRTVLVDIRAWHRVVRPARRIERPCSKRRRPARRAK